MLTKLRTRMKQLNCDHSDIESGSSGAIMVTATDYYKCRKCGLYGDDWILSNNATRRNYNKLNELWLRQKGIR